jgi:hypothetical protein
MGHGHRFQSAAAHDFIGAVLCCRQAFIIGGGFSSYNGTAGAR